VHALALYENASYTTFSMRPMEECMVNFSFFGDYCTQHELEKDQVRQWVIPACQEVWDYKQRCFAATLHLLEYAGILSTEYIEYDE
jgi:hypothetical protein